MLARAMAKQLSDASAHECLFVDFLSEKEPKKVSELLKHHGWVDAMQDELNQFNINKVLTLFLVPYGFDLKGYSNSDYAGCNMDRKSTSGAYVVPTYYGWKVNSLAMTSFMKRDHILKGVTELHFIPTQYQLDDIFTKLLDEPTFKRLIVELEEPITLDKPESPNPFLPANQVEFTFEEIAFTTNNEVELLYPSHANQEYFKDVADFIFKCGLKEAFIRASTQYKECGIRERLGKMELSKRVSFLLDGGSNPSVLVDKTKSARDRLKTAHDDSGINKESKADDISLKVKMEDLSDILKDTRFEFFTPDSPPDDPTSSISKISSNSRVNGSSSLTSVLAKKELEHAKAKAKAEVTSMKAKPSFPDINQLTDLLVTVTLNRFATMVESTSTGQATASPAKGEKTTKDAKTNLKNELIDLLGINIVIQYYTKNLLFDKYCDKMLKRKKIPKITNSKILIKKVPITLKIYREDGSDEVISNLKVSDRQNGEK
uniref:Copia protein n=1 Tax=Tanacetum cinerariifolium TaxID=118510 RepID=A0A6L2MUJ4_TANCI|nr:copia protein [Tanacetum cinerariifolium]